MQPRTDSSNWRKRKAPALDADEATALDAELVRLKALPRAERPRGFKTLLLRWHPDKHPDEPSAATETFQFLQAKKAWVLDGDVER